MAKQDDGMVATKAPTVGTFNVSVHGRWIGRVQRTRLGWFAYDGMRLLNADPLATRNLAMIYLRAKTVGRD